MLIDYKRSALIIVDVQNDFCPAYTSSTGRAHPQGALAVDGGGDVCAPLNDLARRFSANGGKVVATQDWHPRDHISFASAHPGGKIGDSVDGGVVKSQILWSDHCVQGTDGAAFHDELDLNPIHLIIRKGENSKLDSYSTFFENDRQTPTGLEGYLKTFSITDVYLGGLATDYCVLYSSLDAQRLHFKTFVIKDAVRGVDFPEGSVERAFNAMKAININLISLEDLK